MNFAFSSFLFISSIFWQTTDQIDVTLHPDKRCALQCDDIKWLGLVLSVPLSQCCLHKPGLHWCLTIIRGQIHHQRRRNTDSLLQQQELKVNTNTNLLTNINIWYLNVKAGFFLYYLTCFLLEWFQDRALSFSWLSLLLIKHNHSMGQKPCVVHVLSVHWSLLDTCIQDICITSIECVGVRVPLRITTLCYGRQRNTRMNNWWNH